MDTQNARDEGAVRNLATPQAGSAGSLADTREGADNAGQVCAEMDMTHMESENRLLRDKVRLLDEENTELKKSKAELEAQIMEYTRKLQELQRSNPSDPR